MYSMRKTSSYRSKLLFALTAGTVVLPCAAYAAPPVSPSASTTTSRAVPSVKEVNAREASSGSAKTSKPAAPVRSEASTNDSSTGEQSQTPVTTQHPPDAVKLGAEFKPTHVQAPSANQAVAPADPAAAEPGATTDDAQAAVAGQDKRAGEPTAVPADAPPSHGAPRAPEAPAAQASSRPEQPLPPEAPLVAYFDLGLVVQTNWNTDPAFDFFSDNDVVYKGGLGLGVDVAHVGAATLAVDVNALFSQTSGHGELPAYISGGKVTQTDLGGGLTLRYGVTRWFAPQLRVGGGAAFQDAILRGPDFGKVRQDRTTGYLTLGGGLAFTTPGKRLSRTRTWFNSLGLRVIAEGGYHLGQDLDFTVKAKPANGADAPNPIAQTSLGVLPQAGPYLRVSAQARF